MVAYGSPEQKVFLPTRGILEAMFAQLLGKDKATLEALQFERG